MATAKKSCLVAFSCLIVGLPSLAQSTVLTGNVTRNRVSVQGDQPYTIVTTVVPAGRTLNGRIVNAGPQKVYVERPVYHKVYVQDGRTFWQRHPKVKAATVGAGVGTAAGAVAGALSGKGIVRGAVIGAGTGAGVGLVRSSDTLRRHPIVKDVSTGALVGLGIGGATSRKEGRLLKGAGIGAAVGLGASLLKNGLQ